MLVIERNENGRTVVRLHKDWHIGRMSSAYTPPKRNYVACDAEWLQTTLLETRRTRRTPRLAVPDVERGLHPHPAAQEGEADH